MVYVLVTITGNKKISSVDGIDKNQSPFGIIRGPGKILLGFIH
jgi:hypothetical protein